ncbi:MAG: DUF58 domain-containing protein [Planctomycetota bacterium]|jgi:uncharacterized protein (DUF58 family)
MIFTPREIAQLRRLELLAAKVRKGQLHGEREMHRPGPGSGFREHRAYHEGDEVRRVDWHVYARMDALVVKEFEAEEALDLVVVQDCSASMRGAAAVCAAKVAAALGTVALLNLDRVRWIPAGGTRGAETFVSRGRLGDLLEVVDLAPAGGTDLLAAVQASLPRRSRGGVAFVLSDFFDPRGATRALSHLLSRRYRVRALLIEDPETLAPPPPGRTRLVDAETGAVLKLDVTPDAIEEYWRARRTRMHGLRGFCRRTGAGFLRVRAAQPFFEIVRATIARGWLTP